jgi:choline/glycine/proline betaine transport protein
MPHNGRYRHFSPVFLISAGLMVLFVLFGAIFSEQAGRLFQSIQSAIVTGMGWFYVGAVATFLAFVVWLRFSRYRNVKLGPDDSEPDYSYPSWFAMLFSAGMGIGLLFFSVAEPIMHFASPPVGPGQDVAAAREAMRITFFHWGLHAWAIYIVVGLSLAYFAFRHNLPLTIRSSLYPLLGRKIFGPIGATVDIFAVLGTLFGVATSLGLGVMQVNAGLNVVFGVPVGTTTFLILIAAITLIATASVALGLDKGIKRLSEMNLVLGVTLLLFVLFVGPTVFILDAFFQNVGNYLQNIVYTTFQTYPFIMTDWHGSWTLFYWGWWIAWSPFVGMFIARISRGRTIGEFITGVLLVPTLLTFIWMTVFGNTALFTEMFGGGGIIAAVNANEATALFVLLGRFPFATVTSLLATIVVVTFFVTSSDSGSLVIGIITKGGMEDPPLAMRIFWAITEGGVAAVLLVAGGLTALQTASIATGLPFAAILLIMCYGLLKGLRRERLVRPVPESRSTHRGTPSPS